MAEYKYPWDIVSYVRKKTFSIEARFSNNTEDSPLKVFDHFSRFVFCVIQNKQAAKCNIPLDRLIAMDKISDYCYNKHITRENKPLEPADNANIAYTTRFLSGKYKGMTPVEVLINDPENGKKELNSQYTWLKSNLEKYPNNKVLLDAIMEASKIDLSDVKQVKASDAPITILDIPARPLVRKTREDGKCQCYECKITWDFSKNYPVSCIIKNYYAPVKKTDAGLYNIILKDKDTKTEMSNEFNMTAEEWMNAVDQMKTTKNTYYMLNANKAFKLVNEAYIRESKENTK